MKKFLANSIFKAAGWTYNVDPEILEKKNKLLLDLNIPQI